MPCISCPLCLQSGLVVFYEQTEGIPWRLYSPDSDRAQSLIFYRCRHCNLITKDPAVRSTSDQQRRHYQKHNNDLSDMGYREHLMRVIRPLRSLLGENANGLDYGCGPILSIGALMKTEGIDCHSFDPFFFPDQSLLTSDTYDFITCAEVVEHFNDPHNQFQHLYEMLRPDGLLAVMTQLPPPSFKGWWYHRDPTHVAFYSEETFDWIARYWHMSRMVSADNVFILRK